jgi:hypothetical protein
VSPHVEDMTDKQRRWWFAHLNSQGPSNKHRQKSSVHPPIEKRQGGDSSKRPAIDPKAVDRYAAEALKYLSGDAAILVEEINRVFGTQAVVDTQRGNPIPTGGKQVLTAQSGPDHAPLAGVEGKGRSWKDELHDQLKILYKILATPIRPKPPDLKTMHTDRALDKRSLEYWRKQPSEEIVKSLQTPGNERLRIRPDGTVLQGNHRVKVLLERGYDTSKLYKWAEIMDKKPIGPLD